ncbi:MAG: DMT family transporter [Pseudomonadota bacterium]
MKPRAGVLALTVLAMLAFAGNSLLCRLALKTTGIDAASFTALRLVSGALVLYAIVRQRGTTGTGSWLSALALFVYAAAFSLAYIQLSAATGALILFGVVQFTMAAHGFAKGERLGARQALGWVIAIGGLVVLLMPGLLAPSPQGAALMTAAGIAWGIYSLRGKSAGDPVRETAGNFIKSVPYALLLMAAAAGLHAPITWDGAGIAYALVSGALTSGVGYVIWYAAVKHLRATSAASVQLSVPAIAAVGGVALLGEPISWTLALSCAAILGGVALSVLSRRPG